MPAIVQQPRVGADLLHVLREVQHHRDGAQGAEHAAHAQRIGDGLAQAVLLRNLEVSDGAGIVAADLDGVDDVVRAAQRRLAVLDAQILLDLGLGAVVAVDGLEHHLGLVQTGLVNIVQRNGALRQRGGHHAVAQNVLREHRGTGAHESDFRHGKLLLQSSDSSGHAALFPYILPYIHKSGNAFLLQSIRKMLHNKKSSASPIKKTFPRNQTAGTQKTNTGASRDHRGAAPSVRTGKALETRPSAQAATIAAPSAPHKRGSSCIQTQFGPR